MKTPQLSVIMGAHNIGHLKVFDAAMDSILNQTKPNFEFIICDDGSTDHTYELLTELAEKDSRVRLLRSTQNEGLASALNRCIKVARADFIARQDADDISARDRFEKQLVFLNKHPEISFVGSNVILFDETGDWGKRVFPPFPESKDFLFNMPFVHGTLMFRRKCLLDVGCYRVAKVTRRMEDYDLLMRMYSAGMHGANIQEPLYRFLEDLAAMKRRKYRYRIDEAEVRWHGFRNMGLMPGAVPWVVKPLIVGLIPPGALQKLKLCVGREF